MSALYFGKRGAHGNVYVDLFNLLYDKRQGQYISEKKDNALANAVIDRLEGLIEVLFRKEENLLSARPRHRRDRAKEKRQRDLLRIKKEKESMRSHRIASKLSKQKEREARIIRRRALNLPMKRKDAKETFRRKEGKIMHMIGNIIGMVSKKQKTQTENNPNADPKDDFNLSELFNEDKQPRDATVTKTNVPSNNQPLISESEDEDQFVDAVDSSDKSSVGDDDDYKSSVGDDENGTDNNSDYYKLNFDDDANSIFDLEDFPEDDNKEVAINDFIDNKRGYAYNLDTHLNIFVDGNKQTLRRFLETYYKQFPGDVIYQSDLDAMRANTLFSLLFKNDLEVTIDSKVIVYTCLELLDCLIIEPDALDTFRFMKFNLLELEVVMKLCAAELCILLLYGSKFNTLGVNEALTKVVLDSNKKDTEEFKQLQAAAITAAISKWVEHVHVPLMNKSDKLIYGPMINSSTARGSELLNSLSLTITGYAKQAQLAEFVKQWLETTTFFNPVHISNKKYFCILIDDYERLNSGPFYKFMMDDAVDANVEKEFTLYEIQKWLSHCLYITYITVRPRVQTIVPHMLDGQIMDILLNLNDTSNLTTTAKDELADIKKGVFELYFSTVTNPFATKMEACLSSTSTILFTSPNAPKDLYQAYDEEEEATLCRAPIFSFRKPMLEQAKKYLFTRFSIAEHQWAAIEHQLELYALRSMESSLLADDVDEFYTQARLFFVKGFVHVGLEHPRVWMRPILYILYKITLKTSIFWLTANQQRLNEMFDFEKSVVLKQPTIDFKTFQNYTSLLT